jgi:hypothetical protein
MNPESERRVLSVCAVVSSLALVLAIAPAARAASPRWQVETFSDSTVSSPDANFEYLADISNVGSAASNAEPVEVTVSPPLGVVASQGTLEVVSGGLPSGPTYPCSGLGTGTLHCVAPAGVSSLPPNNGEDLLKVRVRAAVGPGLSGMLSAVFSVSGGGAPPAGTIASTRVTASPSFGLAAFDTTTALESGATATAAGSHPFLDSTDFELNTSDEEHGLLRGLGWSLEPLRDSGAELPPGLLGDPTVMARCTLAQLANGFQTIPESLCPVASQVGTASVRFKFLKDGFGGGLNAQTVPVFDLIPPPGVPASFGFDVSGTVVVLNAHLRSGASGYFLAVEGPQLSEGLATVGTRIHFWGVPAAESHDPERACPGQRLPSLGGPTAPAGCPYARPAEQAFLREPTSCVSPSEGLATRFYADSWVHPGARAASGAPDLSDPAWKTAVSVSHEAPGYPLPDGPSVFPEAYGGPTEWGPTVGIEGCEAVPFSPSFEAKPTAVEADSPSGLHVGITMPQQGLDEPEAIAESDLKRVTVTLPPGVSVNPSSANGQQACTAAQVGLTSAPGATPVVFDEEPVGCPDASKIGSVELESPLLGRYDQNNEPLLDAEGHHVLEKLLGLPRQGTRQPVRVSDRPLPGCGRRTDRHSAEAPRPCEPEPVDRSAGNGLRRQPAAAVHAPVARSVRRLARRAAPPRRVRGISDRSGAHRLVRQNRRIAEPLQGRNGTRRRRVPGGRVPSCLPGRDRVECGRCLQSVPALVLAQRGSVTVLSGSGAAPVTLHGTVYLTGPYNGGPFGDVVVVPAVAGPFNLGNVVQRDAIRIDPVTAQAVILGDPFPLFVGDTGIPTVLRRVDVVIDRPGFTFNATSCDPEAVTATLTGAQGTAVGALSRYQATGCQNLKFKPSFKASTQANGTFNRGGASLDVKIATKQGPGGPEANIRKVEVQLPKKLPARLTTLQKACTETQFAANPAGCPAASDVGTAIAHTPLLDSPVTGPAYLVSHGGQAFDLVLILQGEGIVLQVTGHTQIKNGITYSRFETVPDAPISTFELNLPESPTSALAATESLCSNTRTVTVKKRVLVRHNGKTRRVTRAVKTQVAEPLTMPTTITAQDNAVLNQNTKIAVTGCPKKTAAKPHKKPAAKGRKGKAHGKG